MQCHRSIILTASLYNSLHLIGTTSVRNWSYVIFENHHSISYLDFQILTFMFCITACIPSRPWVVAKSFTRHYISTMSNGTFMPKSEVSYYCHLFQMVCETWLLVLNIKYDT